MTAPPADCFEISLGTACGDAHLDDGAGIGCKHAIPGLALQVDSLMDLPLDVVLVCPLGRLEPVAGLARTPLALILCFGAKHTLLGTPEHQRRVQRR